MTNAAFARDRRHRRLRPADAPAAAASTSAAESRHLLLPRQLSPSINTTSPGRGRSAFHDGACVVSACSAVRLLLAVGGPRVRGAKAAVAAASSATFECMLSWVVVKLPQVLRRGFFATRDDNVDRHYLFPSYAVPTSDMRGMRARLHSEQAAALSQNRSRARRRVRKTLSFVA